MRHTDTPPIFPDRDFAITDIACKNAKKSSDAPVPPDMSHFP
jgi:hypothetical protein